MSFCVDCGLDHHAGERTAAEQVNAEVEIERLRTRRDIEVARITASASKDIAETEAEPDLARAEGAVEGMAAVLDTIAGGGEPPAIPGGPPIIVEPPAEEVPDETPDIEPPPPAVEVTPPAKRGGGYWG